MYLLHLLGRLEIFSILLNTTNLHNFEIYVLLETPIDHLFFDSCLFLIEIMNSLWSFLQPFTVNLKCLHD